MQAQQVYTPALFSDTKIMSKGLRPWMCHVVRTSNFAGRALCSGVNGCASGDSSSRSSIMIEPIPGATMTFCKHNQTYHRGITRIVEEASSSYPIPEIFTRHSWSSQLSTAINSALLASSSLRSASDASAANPQTQSV